MRMHLKLQTVYNSRRPTDIRSLPLMLYLQFLRQGPGTWNQQVWGLLLSHLCHPPPSPQRYCCSSELLCPVFT